MNTRLAAILCTSLAAIAALFIVNVKRAHADPGPGTCARLQVPAQICEYQFADGTKCVVYGLTGNSDTAQVGSSSAMQCKFL